MFGQGESEASSTHPVQVSSLRKGGYVMIRDRPCKILDMSTSKTGKHGHAKVHLVAFDIFTGRKVEFIGPGEGHHRGARGKEEAVHAGEHEQ